MKVQEVKPGQLLSSQELADFLKVPINTIHRWRSNGNAPKAVRVGRHLRFAVSDVLQWMEDRSR